ncbi:hypothetical protein VTK73DRAFT_7518 [Phialemonium thermophilum]|uniref:Extracellular serine-rich protein n=1 Tax=Phialemonium thermophilum TaxID=223376 RepID=A0ABR3WEQ1_9PEZI
MLSRLLFLAISLSTTTVRAATIQINAGEGNKLTFTPDSVKAEVGDVLEFHFVGGFHDAVRGDFDKPCQPFSGAAGGFASDRVQGSATNNKVFRVTVNTTDPIFFYCSVGAHCANGMVGAVNPTDDQTVAAYAAAAKGKTASRPTDTFGGVTGTA